jgi:hypothetical protein
VKDLAFVDVEHVGIEQHGRELRREVRGGVPVRGRPAAVEQPGVRERKGAGTDRHHAGATPRRAPQLA